MTEPAAQQSVLPDCDTDAFDGLQEVLTGLSASIRPSDQMPGGIDWQSAGQQLVLLHEVLSLMERSGAALLAGQMRALAAHCQGLPVQVAHVPTRVLADACQHLYVYLEYLKKSEAVDNAALLTAMLNRCRSARSLPVWSDVWLQARLIPVPDPASLREPTPAELEYFRKRAGDLKGRMIQRFLVWYRDGEGAGHALEEIEAVFSQLVLACPHDSTLTNLAALFESSSVICTAVRQRRLDGGAALKRLFASIENLLQECILLPAATAERVQRLVPEELLQTLLYFVARAGPRTARAASLHQRFQLQRHLLQSRRLEQCRLALAQAERRLQVHFAADHSGAGEARLVDGSAGEPSAHFGALAPVRERLRLAEMAIATTLDSGGRIAVPGSVLESLQACSETLAKWSLPEGQALLDAWLSGLASLPEQHDAVAICTGLANAWVLLQQYLEALARQQPVAGAMLIAAADHMALLRPGTADACARPSSPVVGQVESVVSKHAVAVTPGESRTGMSAIVERLTYINRHLATLQILQAEPLSGQGALTLQATLVRLAASLNSMVESARRMDCEPVVQLATASMRLTSDLMSTGPQVPGLVSLALLQEVAALLPQVLADHVDGRHTLDIRALLRDLAAENERLKIATAPSDRVSLPVGDVTPNRQAAAPGARASASPPVDPGSDESLDAVFDREARDLLAGLRIDARDLQADVGGRVLSRMMAGLHTLKGSARMARHSELAERTHQLEQELQQAAASSRALLADDGLAWLQQAMPAVHPASDTRASRAIASMTVDRVLSLTTQSTFAVARLGESLGQVRELLGDLERLAPVSADHERPGGLHPGADEPGTDEPGTNDQWPAAVHWQQALKRMRTAVGVAESQYQQASRSGLRLQQGLLKGQLQRVDSLHSRLCTSLNDACRGLDKRASLSISGGQLPVERELLDRLLAPLEHLIRNAVAHGIELREERKVRGKPVDGQVQLQIEVDATDLLLSVHDDGAGVDLTAVDRVREQRGERAAGTAEELCRLLCEPGFSTRAKASQVAGRGLGLDAVRQLVEGLGGQLSLTTRQNHGTCVQMRLPQTATLSELVLVRSGRRLYGLPASAIVMVLMANDARIDQGLRWGTRYWPLHRLADSLAGTPPGVLQASGAQTAVLIEMAGQALALLVDECPGARELIVRPLGTQVTGLRRFWGGAVLPDGQQLLVLDPTWLLPAGQSEAVSPEGAITRSNVEEETLDTSH